MKRVNTAARSTLLVWGCLLAAGRPARAAEPTIEECLDSYEASLTFKNEDKLAEALSRLEVCSSIACPTDVRNECVRRAADLEAALAREKEQSERAAAPPPTVVVPPPVVVPPSAAPNRIAQAIVTRSPSTNDRRSWSFYTRWWFWTAVAVVASVGVTTAVILSRPETLTVGSPYGVMRADPR